MSKFTDMILNLDLSENEAREVFYEGVKASTRLHVEHARDSQMYDLNGNRIDEYVPMPAAVRKARQRASERAMRAKVEELRPRKCAKCHHPISGRSDKKYCSGACRTEAHRWSHVLALS